MSHRDKTERITEGMRFLRAVSPATDPTAPMSFAGNYFSIDDLVLRPCFVQRPLPIWLPPARAPASVVERVLRRIAVLADGWLTFAVSPALLKRRLGLLHELAASRANDIMVGLLGANPRRQLHRITEQLLPLITDR